MSGIEISVTVEEDELVPVEHKILGCRMKAVNIRRTYDGFDVYSNTAKVSSSAAHNQLEWLFLSSMYVKTRQQKHAERKAFQVFKCHTSALSLLRIFLSFPM